MAMDNDVIEVSGKCVCGGVRFTAKAEPRIFACHCKMCQEWAAGPYMSVRVHDLEMKDTDGALARFRSSEWAGRYFCGLCGTLLAWSKKDSPRDFINHALIAQSKDFPFATEVCVESAHPSYAFDGERERLTSKECGFE